MKPSNPASLPVAPAPPQQTGNNRKPTVLTWPLITFSKLLKTKFQYCKSLPNKSKKEKLQSKGIQSALDRLKIMYGALHRRSLVWGTNTLNSIDPTRSTFACNVSFPSGKSRTHLLRGWKQSRFASYVPYCLFLKTPTTLISKQPLIWLSSPHIFYCNQ